MEVSLKIIASTHGVISEAIKLSKLKTVSWSLRLIVVVSAQPSPVTSKAFEVERPGIVHRRAS